MTGRRRPVRGRLIALEGIDGAGKSTLARSLARALRRDGFSVALRREPADPTLGRLAQSSSVRDPWSGAIYFTLDRYLARRGLERDLARHDFVVSDRSFFSTLAYQGSALSPRDKRRLEEMQRDATPAPDRVLLIDLSPTKSLERLGSRGSRRAPLERRATLERVYREYRSLARRHRWAVLDGRLPPRDLTGAALEALRQVGSRRTRSGRPRRR